MVAHLHSPKAFTVGWLVLLLFLVSLGHGRESERRCMACMLLIVVTYVAVQGPVLWPASLESLDCFDRALPDLFAHLEFVEGVSGPVPKGSHGPPS